MDGNQHRRTDPTPTAYFDENNDYAISWSQQSDQDNNGQTSVGVYFDEYALAGTQIRTVSGPTAPSNPVRAR